MNVMALLYVACGGAVGAMLRYLGVNAISRFNPTEFPYGTMLVNILGSMLMGVWLACVLTMPNVAKAKDLHLLLAVGVLGGFTTFSAFSFDIFSLVQRGAYAELAFYITGSVGLSVCALLMGIALVKWVTI